MKIFKEFPSKRPEGELLNTVEFPSDLKKLKLDELEQLADELREFLLYSVSQTGGHFGAPPPAQEGIQAKKNVAVAAAHPSCNGIQAKFQPCRQFRWPTTRPGRNLGRN